MELTDRQLLDAALSFIVDREGDDDYICERMNDEWCEENCNNLTKECVIRFIKEKILNAVIKNES